MSLGSLDRLERLQRYFVNNDISVGDEEAPQGPVELDPSLLYGQSDDDDDDEYKYVDDESIGRDMGHVVRKDGLHGSGVLNSEDLVDEGIVSEHMIGTKVYSSHYVNKEDDDERSTECVKGSIIQGDPFKSKAHICHNGVEIQGKRPEGQKVSLPDRLLARHGKKRDADVKRWKEEYEREYREQCTFAPSVLQDAVKARLCRDNETYNIPIDKRLSIEWRRKEQRLLDATKRADRDATFHPEINTLSRQIAEKRRERMMRGFGGSSMKRSHEEVTHGTCQKLFTCRHSDTILKSSESIPRGFKNRQEYFHSKYERNQLILSAKDAHVSDFKANIPKKLIMSSSRLAKQMNESREERVNRMALGDATAIEARRLERKQALDAQFQYKPTLNKKSLQMATSDHVSSGQTRLRRIQEYQEGLYDECTFKPNTSKPSVHGFYSQYTIPDGYTKYSIAKALREGSIDDFLKEVERCKQEKARLAQEVRNERLAKELEECSFVPQINRKILKPNEDNTPLHLMPGMQGFLQKLEMIETKRNDKKEREKAAFVQTDHWTQAPTVIQPFNLSCERTKA